MVLLPRKFGGGSFAHPETLQSSTCVHLFRFLFCMLLLLYGSGVASHPLHLREDITVTGKVTGQGGTPLPGVSVILKSNQSTGVVTAPDGSYSIKVPANGTLIFRMVGYIIKEIAVQGESRIDVVLEVSESKLNEVVLVGFGTQKKTSVVASVTTINPKELKVPSSNLTTALAGRLAGVVSFQRGGAPGQDNANFFIRGVSSFGSGKIDPLILIDGIEMSVTDLARLQPDDIKDFSILKDATAASVYGARGANGVILVNTKMGTDEKAKLAIRLENSTSSNAKNFRLADPVTMMRLQNEAVMTRNPLGILPYSYEKIAETEKGADPLLYPKNDWMKQLIANYSNNQRANFNLNGGGKVSQYYVSASYNRDKGILNSEARNNFGNNIDLKAIQIRSNVNVNITKTTTAVIRASGQFDDYTGPVGGGDTIFRNILGSNQVMFPAVYPASANPQVKHTLFGSAFVPGTSGLFINPYAEMVKGHQDWNRSTMLIQAELKQNFDFLLPGLSARLMTYTQRYSYFSVSRQFNPFYYQAVPDGKEGYSLNLLNEGKGTEYLDYGEGPKEVNTNNYVEAAINYSKTFSKVHDVSGMLIYIRRNSLTANAGDLQTSLPSRNVGVSGRFTYGYDNRYMGEVNFGYNGSERFSPSHRFGFFPSAGVAWYISNEKMFEPLRPVISNLKLRATYGLVGNDAIGSAIDRFFYLSNVNMNNSAAGAVFGREYTERKDGISITRYANPDISWEVARKTNLGLELGLFNSAEIVVDFWKEHRTNILMDRASLPYSMGLSAPVRANVGEASSSGFEAQLNYNKSFGDFWLQARGTFTYAKSEYLVYEEPHYAESYRSRIGTSLGQVYGLIAERLFVDEEEVRNSPKQNFGEYMAGDIKYRDLNGDNQITDADKVPIGYPVTPEVIYGFGFSAGYKAFDCSIFFQGSARSSFWIDVNKVSPFVVDGGYQNGLLQAWADDHWSEDNKNDYAQWPRLSTQFMGNNNQVSTWFMRNGSFLRLKNAEIGYTIPKQMLSRLKMSSARIYINSANLFSISKFKLWDTEMGGNGLGYPIQRVVNAGIQIGF